MHHLVLVTGTLAVLSQALHGLVDESYVLLIDVESQQPQSARGAATDAVQELKRLTHQVIVVLVVLVAQKVLGMEGDEAHADCGATSGPTLFPLVFRTVQCLCTRGMCDADQGFHFKARQRTQPENTKHLKESTVRAASPAGLNGRRRALNQRPSVRSCEGLRCNSGSRKCSVWSAESIPFTSTLLIVKPTHTRFGNGCIRTFCKRGLFSPRFHFCVTECGDRRSEHYNTCHSKRFTISAFKP